MLTGKLALAKGESDAAIRAFEEGIAAEDTMPYLEPPMWGSPCARRLAGPCSP